jgi:hypothetical protein
MSSGQREKIMVEMAGSPIDGTRIMTLRAVGGKSGNHVVGIFSCCEIAPVAIHTFVSDPVEPKIRFRFMTVGTA